VAAKEKVWDARHDFDRLMQEATRALAAQTRTLAVAATKAGDVYHAGYANILEAPEFYDIDVTRTVLSILDEAQSLLSLFGKSFGEEATHLLLGEELGYEFLEPCGMVFTDFEAGPKRSGSVGVIGPSRLYYPRIIPTVRYFGNLIEELAKGF
jgi:heat-inducible transcriptional repressor